MKKKMALLDLLSVVLLSATVVIASAQPRIVGVTSGDWFMYGDITSDWISDDPNATTPFGFEFWQVFEEIEWVRLSVEQVSGTNITFHNTVHFTNDTEETSGGSVDVDTGEGNLTLHAISANLGADDSVYTSGEHSTWKINETVMRTYPDGVRETNHLNMTYEFSFPPYSFYMSMNFYWDRGTGIIVEMALDWENRTGEYLSTWAVSYRISDSNVWVIPEFTTWISIILIFAIPAVPIVIYKRRMQTTIQ